jgi:hypothetical protein
VARCAGDFKRDRIRSLRRDVDDGGPTQSGASPRARLNYGTLCLPGVVSQNEQGSLSFIPGNSPQ